LEKFRIKFQNSKFVENVVQITNIRLQINFSHFFFKTFLGTERNKDSMHHDAEQRKEGAEINASLFALKECIRTFNRNKNDGRTEVIPFRQSSLTKVLAEAFKKNAQLSVICTASPCCTDTEHSITTLRTGFNLSGRNDDASDETEQAEFASLLQVEAKTVSHPKSWTPDQVQQLEKFLKIFKTSKIVPISPTNLF